MIQEVADASGRRYPVVGTPIHQDGEPFCSKLSPPRLGEHSEEVLRGWLGYDEVRVRELLMSGAVTQ